MKSKTFLSRMLVILVALITLVACSARPSSQTNEKEKIRIGRVNPSESQLQVWQNIQELASSSKTPIQLEFKDFKTNALANKALVDGKIQVNIGQDAGALAEWNQDNNQNLVAVGETYISPIRLYSGLKSNRSLYLEISQLPEKAEILISDDPIMQSRSLFLLQIAGLIKIESGANGLASLSTIKENPRQLEFKAMADRRIVKALSKADAGFVDNRFVIETGLDYRNALFTEPIDSNAKKWASLLVANQGWEETDKASSIKKIVKLYQTDEVRKVLDETSFGFDQAAW